MIGPEFLEPEGVRRLHDRALAKYCSIPGPKGYGMLPSGFDRPQNKLIYSECTMLDRFDLAAAYAFDLATNHAFDGGNKRTAWSACVLFLKINRVELDVPAAAGTERLPLLAPRTTSAAAVAVAAWLRTIARPPSTGAIQ